MAKTKTDRRSSADSAPPAKPRRARAKPTDEQRAKLASMRQRVRLAELELAGRETLERIAPPAGPPIRRRDPIADQLAALRSIETARPDEWARFDEAAERLADELARRWGLDLAAAFGDEDHEQLIADFVERQHAELLADARIELHKLTEWPGDNSPEGCLASIRRARAWCGDESPLEIRLSDEGREKLARLTAEPPRPAGAHNPQLVAICTYLAELPAGARVKPAELREKLRERCPRLAMTDPTIRHGIARGRRLNYLAPSAGTRGGAVLTAMGRQFAATVTAPT